MRKRKGKQERKKRREGEKENKKKRIRREKERKRRKKRKEKGKISRLSGCRSSTVRGLKLVHAPHSTCGHQKVGVSTTCTR